MSGKTTEGAQTGSLTVGSAISGQVMKVEGDTVYVKLPSEVLTAKLQEGVNLQPGQSVTFAVSGISDKQITLQALFQNSAQTQVLGKALEQAGIVQTADSLSMDRMSISPWRAWIAARRWSNTSCWASEKLL